MLSEFEFGTSKSREVHAKSRDVYISASPFFLGLMHLKPTKKSFLQRIDVFFVGSHKDQLVKVLLDLGPELFHENLMVALLNPWAARVFFWLKNQGVMNRSYIEPCQNQGLLEALMSFPWGSSFSMGFSGTSNKGTSLW